MTSKLLLSLILVGLCLIKINKSDIGTPQNSNNSWVTYIPGDSPIIIVASHDGTIEPPFPPAPTYTPTPTTMKERINGCRDPGPPAGPCVWENPCQSPRVESKAECPYTISRDTNTKLIAECLQNSATWISPSPSSHTFHPHYIYNNLNRTRMDANRDILKGCAGEASCEYAWDFFHDRIQDAITDALTNCDFAIVIDIHGHGRNDFTMMGYNINETHYDTNANLDDETKSTIEGLSIRSDATPSQIHDIVRGANSLGELLNVQRTDWKTTPSETYPDPNLSVGDDYFQGDYIVDTYGSQDCVVSTLVDCKVDSVQIEIPKWIRDSSVERASYCAGLAEAIVDWVKHWHSSRYTSCTY